MIKCNKCNVIKEQSEFRKHRNICKFCHNIHLKNHRKTVDGLVSKIYGAQRKSSKTRNHPMPEYSNKELKKWIIQQPNFSKLFSDWEKSNYLTELIPSVDRIDDSNGYTFDNIQLITWEENNLKGYLNRVRRRRKDMR